MGLSTFILGEQYTFPAANTTIIAMNIPVFFTNLNIASPPPLNYHKIIAVSIRIYPVFILCIPLGVDIYALTEYIVYLCEAN